MKSNQKPEIRLQKYIADAGVTSKRKAEELIVQGRVEVNGQKVVQLGTKVRPESDVVFVDGSAVDPKEVQKIYMVMHKPRGVMTTVSDPEGRETVLDLCKEISERIYPVGRLDYLSEGLLLMTNDGDFANQVIHPSQGVEKVYEVKVFGIVNETILRKLQKGVMLDDGFARPESVRILKHLHTKTWLEFRLKEGRNREVRRICEAVGVTVDKLKRVAIGGLSVLGVAPGKYQLASKEQLLRAIGIDKQGKVHDSVKFRSPKRTLNLKRKVLKPGTPADDENFQIYRKERYFQTLKEMAISKEKEALKAERERKEAMRR